MAEPAFRRMTSSEFLLWQAREPESYELVDGRPEAMTGATRRHDLVVINAISAFRARLRGGPCRPSSDDIAVVSPNDNVRRPDMTVDCGPVDGGAMTSGRPVLVLEVLSPSTARVDAFEKLEEYKGLGSVSYILIADAGRPHVVAYVRSEDRTWSQLSYVGLEAEIALPEIGCTLPLSELYEDVDLSGLNG